MSSSSFACWHWDQLSTKDIHRLPSPISTAWGINKRPVRPWGGPTRRARAKGRVLLHSLVTHADKIGICHHILVRQTMNMKWSYLSKDHRTTRPAMDLCKCPWVGYAPYLKLNSHPFMNMTVVMATLIGYSLLFAFHVTLSLILSAKGELRIHDRICKLYPWCSCQKMKCITGVYTLIRPVFESCGIATVTKNPSYKHCRVIQWLKWNNNDTYVKWYSVILFLKYFVFLHLPEMNSWWRERW